MVCRGVWQAGKPPDFFYCKSLLEAKGIVTVPGTGFRQAEGTLHFRTTILPPESDIEATAQDLTDFHKDFMKKVCSHSRQSALLDRPFPVLGPVIRLSIMARMTQSFWTSEAVTPLTPSACLSEC